MIPWGSIIGGGMGALGSILGKKNPEDGFPAQRTSDHIDQLLRQMQTMYNDTSYWPEFGPRGFSPMNTSERDTIAQLDAARGLSTRQATEFGNIMRAGATGGGGSAMLGEYASRMAPLAGMATSTAARGPSQVGRYGVAEPSRVGFHDVQAPGRIPYHNVMSRDARTNWRMGDTGWLSSNAALTDLLSGKADMTGFSGMLDAAFAPVMRNFEERLMPQVLRADDAYTGGQGGSGKTKIAQRLGEDLSQQMNEQAALAAYQLHQDAKDRQLSAADLVTQGNLGLLGINQAGDLANASNTLQARMASASNRLTADRDSASNLLSARTSSAQNRLQSQLANAANQLAARQSTASNYLSADVANQNAYNQYLSTLMSGASQGAGAANAYGQLGLGYASQLPQVQDMLMGGAQAGALAGQMRRGIDDAEAGYQRDRDVFYENQLQNMTQQYAGNLFSLLGASPISSHQQPTSGTNPILAALQGVIANWPEKKQPQAPIWV